MFHIAKPGVQWSDCHLAAEREILKALVTAGVLIGDVEEMQAASIGSVFFPHGLGHLIGCDTHDVGGYNLLQLFNILKINCHSSDILMVLPVGIHAMD